MSYDSKTNIGHGGCRGEALASLAEICVLEVVSKARGAFETYAKLLQGGQVLRQGLAVDQRFRQGTIVTCRDLFFNRPVRQKQLLSAGCGVEAIDTCSQCMLSIYFTQ